MMDKPNLINRQRSFGGWTEVYEHASSACDCTMRFAVLRPPQAEHRRVPVLYWLSGLTCTEENFITKAGAQRLAAELGLMIVAPDTSPRGLGLPGEDEAYDFGSGAGFYVNATVEPWSRHYHMYDYVVDELPALVQTHLPALPERESVFGHSMGGHGALVAHLRNPGRYRSVSAFAPICAPSQCPWGVKAFTAYLGEDNGQWADYDATALVQRHASSIPILIDQGTADPFYPEQLRPELFMQACREHDVELTLRYQGGYDHSYYFIASFMGDHLRHHALALWSGVTD